MSATVQHGFPAVPEMEPNETEHRRKIARVVNRLNGGKLNATVDVTLRASQTTTTVTDPRIYATSYVKTMALSASAATAEAAGIWFSSLVKGSLTINHASNAAADQNVRLLIIG